MNYDVVIIGVGVVGSAVALGLAQQGHKIAIVDKSSVPPNSPRHLSVNKKSSAFLDLLGVWDAVKPSSMPYSRIQAWDREGTGKVEFSAQDIGQNNLGFIVKEGDLQKYLISSLEQLGVDIFWSKELINISDKGDLVEINLDDGKKLISSALLGADGISSKVRELCNFQIKSWSYDQQAIVGQIDSDEKLDDVIRQSFTKYGPLALLPINSSQMTMIWSVDNKNLKELNELDDDLFLEKLQLEFGEKTRKLKFSSQRFTFPLKHLTAVGFAKGRIAILGDAAHHVHPLAGLGLNSGLGDAESIVKLFSKYPAVKVETIFKQYSNERLPINIGLAAAMELFKRGFGNQNIWLKTLRNLTFKFVDNQQEIKNTFVKLATTL